MRHDISGTVMRTVSIDLDPQEALISQTHAMAWMTDGVSMDTQTGGGARGAAIGGLRGGLLGNE